MKLTTYPTDKHKSYIKKITDVCKEKGLTLILKGSLAKGSGTKYSDIDLILLGEVNEAIVNEIILRYGNPIMTNYTENPKGIMILIYNEFVSVDLDIRETLTNKELRDSIILERRSNIKISDRICRKSIDTKLIPERPHWYKVLRLVHRSFIKYLSGKLDEAKNLINEAKEELLLDKTTYYKDYCTDIRNIYQHFIDNFPIPLEINVLFENLFKAL